MPNLRDSYRTILSDNFVLFRLLLLLSLLPLSLIGLSDEIDHDDRAIDFASHSWNLATGGLKTLTAKHELPSLLERHAIEQQLPKSTYVLDSASVPRSYLFLLIILVCLVIMLISGSIVLFVMLQP